MGNFSQKYLSGDQLKAKCGSPIFVEVVDHATGAVAPADWLDDIHLEVGSAATPAAADSSLGGTSRSLCADRAGSCRSACWRARPTRSCTWMPRRPELETCVLLTNSHGKELLAPGRGGRAA